MFKWVGPIAPEAVGLIAKKERNIKINTMEDMKRYNIGTIRNDVAEQYLTNAGISVDGIDRVAKTAQNIKKLNRGRIDLWAYAENVAMWELNGKRLQSSRL